MSLYSILVSGTEIHAGAALCNILDKEEDTHMHILPSLILENGNFVVWIAVDCLGFPTLLYIHSQSIIKAAVVMEQRS